MSGRKTNKMAHSNRKKLKDSRGGLTKNQTRKSKSQSQNNGGSSSRLQEVTKWMEERETKKLEKETVTTSEVKKFRYAKSRKVINRRKSVIERLQTQLTDNSHPLLFYKNNYPETYDKQVARIKTELLKLKSRI